MSEAVTNAEIEDVLSSIRRLVSENTAAESHRIGSAPSPEEALGKLVLTPAFRVHDGGQGAEEAQVSETDSDESEQTAMSRPRKRPPRRWQRMRQKTPRNLHPTAWKPESPSWKRRLATVPTGSRMAARTRLAQSRPWWCRLGAGWQRGRGWRRADRGV